MIGWSLAWILASESWYKRSNVPSLSGVIVDTEKVKLRVFIKPTYMLFWQWINPEYLGLCPISQNSGNAIGHAGRNKTVTKRIWPVKLDPLSQLAGSTRLRHTWCTESHITIMPDVRSAPSTPGNKRNKNTPCEHKPCSFSALTLLVGWQKGHQTCKRTLLKQSTKVRLPMLAHLLGTWQFKTHFPQPISILDGRQCKVTPVCSSLAH